VDVRRVGSYIRDQREGARLSLRKAAGLAGVSIPYLSQIERGLRRPSADILQAIAKGLRISAETLYVQAGILEDRPVPDVVTVVMADPAISERHKQALVQIYEAFRQEAGREPAMSPRSKRSIRATGEEV
jgi:transcriptional regulator with XRE-family HTH domain